MTKSLKKVLVILVSALILSTCGMFLTVNNGINPASAAEPTEFYMLEEAWLKSTSEGLRFKAYVDKDTGDSIIAGEKKLVFIVAPEDIFAGATSDFKDIAGVKEIEAEPSKLYESDGGYLANVAINNIKPKNRDRAFQAVAAIVEDGVYTYAKSTPSSEEVGPCVDRELYGAVNQAVLAEDTDAESINTLLANYEWFGKTESIENEVVSYPVVVETREQYKSYVNKVVIEKQNDESAIITLPVVYDEVIDDAVKEEVIQEVVDETGEDVQSFVDEVTEALPAVFKVTFVTDAGSNVVSVIEGSVLGNKVDALAGFTFDGWYKDDVAFDLNTEIAGDITLVAKYSKTLEKADYEAFGSVVDGAPVANAAALFNAGETIVSVSAVKDEEEFTAFVNNGTTVTLNVSGGFYGEVTFTVATATKTYTVPVNVITKVIRSQADLENMFIYGGLDSNLNYGGYFVLGNNIHLNGTLANRVGDVDYRAYTNTIENASETRDGKVANNRNQGFTGTFDGQGYTISGLVVGLKNGNIFGNVAEKATVKNLSVIGAFDGSAFASGGAAGLLANQFCGTLTNAYLEYTFTTATAKGAFGAIARNISNAKVTDVVIKVDKNGSTAGDIFSLAYMGVDHIGWQSGAASITNVHTISAGAAVMSSGYSVNATVEENTIEHEVNVAFDFVPTNAECWNLTGNQPAYVSAPVEINYNNDVEVYSSVSNGSPVAGSLEFAVTANSIKSVKVGGNAISYTYNEGLVTINNTELSAYVGTNATIIVETDVRFYIYNLPVIYTKVIKTQTDLENIMIYGGIDANLNYGGYFALGCNIAVSGVLANRVSGVNYTDGVPSAPAMNKGFTGTFDGQGYTISGVVVGKQSGAIFGNVATTGVVKNVAITATMTQVNENTQVVVLANEFSGALTNAYIEVDFAAGSGAAWYSPVAGQSTASKYTDVVVKVDNTNMSGGNLGAFGFMVNKWTAYWENAMSANNVYVFSTKADITLGAYAATKGDGTYYVGSLNNVSINGYDATVAATFADSTYWNLNGTQPIFKTVPVEIDYTDAIEVYSSVVNGVPVANNVEMAISAETILTVKVGGNVVDYTFNAGILSFNAQCLAPYTGSSVALSIETAETVYTYNLLSVVTKVIESQTDLENIMIYGGIDTSTTEMNYGGYFVLGNNIYLSGALANRVPGTDYRAAASWTDNGIEDRDGKVANNGMNGFTGVFDGQGYSIIGYQAVANNGGIFGNVANGATIKNFGVVGQFAQTGSSFVLGNQVNGTIDNVYIEMSYAAGLAAGNYSLIARSTANATLNNIVVKLNAETVINESPIAYMLNDWYGWGVHIPSVTNVYAIGPVTVGYGEKTNVTAKYAITDSVSVTLADATYWDLTGTQPKFKTAINTLTEVAYANQVEVYSQVVDGAPVGATLELSVDAASVNGVYVAGTSVDYTFASGTLSFTVEALAPYAGSNASIIVETDSIVYNYKLSNIVTKVIKTQADLENMPIYGGIDREGLGKNYSGYFVLGNNITITSALANRVPGTDYRAAASWTDNGIEDRDGKVANNGMNGFTGVFDGQGYSIIGYQAVVNNGGIFGNVANGATIKNFGVVGQFAQTGSSFVLGNQVNGTIDNVYIEMSYAAGLAAGNYSLIARSLANATLKNIVVKLNADATISQSTVAYMPNDWYGWGVHIPSVTNVYAIGPVTAGYGDKTTYTATYAITDSVSVTLADATYWDLTGTQPVFTTAKGGN